MSDKRTQSPQRKSWSMEDEALWYMEWFDQFQRARTTGGALGYRTLRRIASVPVVAALLQTRVNQVAEFAVPPRTPYSTGFEIRLRDGAGKMTGAARKEVEHLARFMLQCGVEPADRKEYFLRDTFETFLRKIVWDSLVYDQACFEVVPDRTGKPALFVAVDAATIRRARPKEGSDVAFVQVMNSSEMKVVAEFAPWELAFGVRRPRTAVDLYGYGVPELEELVTVITAFLHGFNYNLRYFEHSGVTKGVLVLLGDMPPEQLRAFRREWYALLTGPENQHRIPIVNPQGKDADIKWLSFGQSARDMEYHEWMDWLLKLVAAVYQIDPAEIGFKFGNEGQSHQMFESSAESRVKLSKDKGLRPLLRAIQTWLNKWVVWQLNPDFELHFTGLDSISEEKIVELDAKRVRSYRTVNEIRAEHGLPPINGGDVILDPNWIQATQMQGNQGPAMEVTI